MNQKATRRLAQQIAHRLQRENGGVVLCDGPLGAGKTTLIKQIIHHLEPAAVVNSPSYTIIQQYSDRIYHVDLYRLAATDDPTAVIDPALLADLGLTDLCVPGNYVFVEWPHGFCPAAALHVRINVKEAGDREFIID